MCNFGCELPSSQSQEGNTVHRVLWGQNWLSGRNSEVQALRSERYGKRALNTWWTVTTVVWRSRELVCLSNLKAWLPVNECFPTQRVYGRVAPDSSCGLCVGEGTPPRSQCRLYADYGSRRRKTR